MTPSSAANRLLASASAAHAVARSWGGHGGPLVGGGGDGCRRRGVTPREPLKSCADLIGGTCGSFALVLVLGSWSLTLLFFSPVLILSRSFRTQ